MPTKLDIGGKFDRVAYRKAYDKVYYKKTAACPRCGEMKVKHQMKRHMKTKKCQKRKLKKSGGRLANVQRW